jgi:hypothetical protein
MEAEQKLNAWEGYPLYDTVLIGEGMGDSQNLQGYNTFKDMAREDEIAFYTKRNRSGAGIPYCNMDSAEQVSFAFLAYSIGVEFTTPAIQDSTDSEGSPAPPKQYNYLAFGNELLKHASLQLQVGQDEKLLSNVLGAPGGGGVTGFSQVGNNSASEATYLGTYAQYSNGSPHLRNRFVFKKPVRIPRNHNISAKISFSTYARGLLDMLSGPGRILINNENVLTNFEDATVPGICTMRVSMIGRREVQQRNAQHFN